jgi:hypothetical protein
MSPETFHSYIKSEVFGKQTEHAFTSRRVGKAGKQLLKQNLALFVCYRVRSLNGARPLLPNFIRNLVEELIKLTREEDEQENFTERLTQSIINNHKSAWAAVTGDEQSKRFLRAKSELTDLSTETKVAAAATIGSLAALQALLRDKDQYFLYEPSLFILHPLAIAASEGHMNIVKAIVKHDIDHCGYSSCGWILWAWEKAIQMCLRNISKGADTLKFLLHMTANLCVATPKGEFKQFLRAAVATAKVDIVLAVLSIKCRSPTACYSDGFAQACEKKFWNIAQLFIERGFIHPNQEFFVNKEDRYECPLSWAAWHGGIGLVRYLLDKGADPSGTGGVKNKPIFRAMRHPRITKMLVEHGADPNFSVHEVVRSSDLYRPKKLKVWKTTPVYPKLPSRHELLADAPTLFPA